MPKKILIVEDEANIRELLRLYLEREGYTVLEAENGVEGIKKWKSDKPDMLLLDVMMPVMDGWEVCREIRAESDVPIIMLTAKGETADRVSGLEMGADDTGSGRGVVLRSVSTTTAAPPAAMHT